MTAVLTEWLIR